MSEPLVSVIIPTYNRAALLREAVDSVRGQTYSHWELIVIDDGSTDETPAVLAGLHEPRLRVLRLPHCGQPGLVRNAGLRLAAGPYVAFLDDDDLWRPEKLAVQVPLLVETRSRWSYTGFVRVDGNGRQFWQTTPDRIQTGRIFESLLETRAAVALPTVVVERSLLDEAGRFDVAMRIHEDYALWLDLAVLADAVATPRQLTVVRDHPGRIHRPEGYRYMVAIYRRWHRGSSERRPRAICRQRAAESYLRAARYRWQMRQPARSLPLIIHALRWDTLHTSRRLFRALRRRISPWTLSRD